jgi:hypothetical protein
MNSGATKPETIDVRPVTFIEALSAANSLKQESLPGDLGIFQAL